MTWWTLPKSEMGGEIKSLLDGYKRDQAGRRTRFLRNLSLYERRSMSSYSAHAYQSSDEGDARERDRLGLVRGREHLRAAKAEAAVSDARSDVGHSSEGIQARPHL
jgi:hypothetical protein